MINVEKAVNGWIIRGRLRGLPVTYVARTRDELFQILETLDT